MVPAGRGRDPRARAQARRPAGVDTRRVRREGPDRRGLCGNAMASMQGLMAGFSKADERAASHASAGSRGRPDWAWRHSASCRWRTRRSADESFAGVVIARRPAQEAAAPSRALAEGTP